MSMLCVLTGAFWWLGGCSSDPAGPPDPERVVLDIDVGGGIAGVSYGFRLDGAAGVIRGTRCDHLCPFAVGATLVVLSPVELAEVVEDLAASGLPELGVRDFGTGCCDQFTFELDYRDGLRRAQVSGDHTTFPDELGDVVARLHAFANSQ